MDNNPTSSIAGSEVNVSPASDREIKLDLTKITTYTPDDDGARPTTTRCYSNGVKKLLYINASHGADGDNPTFTSIYDAIEQYKPQRIIIEAKAGDSTPQGEPAFAEGLARRNAIPVIYAEPPDAAIFTALHDKGYAAKDIMALYLLRMVPQDRREGKRMDEPHFAQRADSYLAYHSAFAQVPQDEKLTYAQFKAEYATRLEGKSFLEAEPKDFAPYTVADASYFQKLSAAVAHVREEMVNTTIAHALNEPGVGTALVIYGGAHRTISDPVWKAALGEGVDVDPAVRKPIPACMTPIEADPFSLSPPSSPGSYSGRYKGP